MTSEKRGICLIVNNDNFSNSSQLKKREGTAVDQSKQILTVNIRCMFVVLHHP